MLGQLGLLTCPLRRVKLGRRGAEVSTEARRACLRLQGLCPFAARVQNSIWHCCSFLQNDGRPVAAGELLHSHTGANKVSWHHPSSCAVSRTAGSTASFRLYEALLWLLYCSSDQNADLEYCQDPHCVVCMGPGRAAHCVVSCWTTMPQIDAVLHWAGQIRILHQDVLGTKGAARTGTFPTGIWPCWELEVRGALAG